MSKEGLEVDGADKAATEEAEKAFKPVIDFIKTTLGDRVEKVSGQIVCCWELFRST